MRDALSQHVLHFAECFGQERILELGYIFPQHSMRLINLVSIHLFQSPGKLVVDTNREFHVHAYRTSHILIPTYNCCKSKARMHYTPSPFNLAASSLSISVTSSIPKVRYLVSTPKGCPQDLPSNSQALAPLSTCASAVLAIVFNALPSLNHEIWGSLKVWFNFASQVLPSLGWTLSVKGLPTASSVHMTSTLSSGLILS